MAHRLQFCHVTSDTQPYTTIATIATTTTITTTTTMLATTRGMISVSQRTPPTHYSKACINESTHQVLTKPLLVRCRRCRGYYFRCGPRGLQILTVCTSSRATVVKYINSTDLTSEVTTPPLPPPSPPPKRPLPWAPTDKTRVRMDHHPSPPPPRLCPLVVPATGPLSLPSSVCFHISSM